MFEFILTALGLWLFFFVVRWLANVIRRAFQRTPPNQPWTRGDNQVRRKAVPVASLGTDAELAEKDYVLELFLIAQKALIGGAGIPGGLRTDLERSKYLHFVVGAIDQLSHTIKDKSNADLWWTTNALGHAVGVFGAAAEQWLEKYGDPDNVTLFQSSSRGAEAMRTFIMVSTDAVSEQDYKSSCLEMFKVVRGA
jgi:hypothetical protein